MDRSNSNMLEGRILARHLAREMSVAETEDVSGGIIRDPRCTNSFCTASGWNPCDLDQCGDWDGA